MNERRYGIASADEIAGLSGREVLEAMIAGRLPAPPMARTLGFRLVEVGDGSAVFEGEPSADLLNPLGIVHGGWALTLIDSAAGCAAHSRLTAGTSYTTVETKVNMTKAITPDVGRIRAEGRVIAQGRRIITTEARMVDKSDRILAHGTSTIMVLPPR